MNNKITFAIITVAIAAVVAGISTIDSGIQTAFAQGAPQGYPPGYPQGSQPLSPQANPQGSQPLSPQANPQAQGPTGTPYGEYLSDPNRNFVGQDGTLNEGILEYLQQQQQQGDTGLGDIRANDESGIGQKYNPGGFGPFTDIANSPP